MKFYVRLILVIISVALFTWSFPLTDLGWLAWIALAPALIALNKAGWKLGIFLGYVFGFTFIYFVVDWFGIFGWEPRVFGSFYFGFFFMLFFTIWGWYSQKYEPGKSWQRIILPPILWVALEWFKGSGIMAFTWGFAGLTQYKFTALIQMASVTGVFGISFMIIFFNNLLAETVLANMDREKIKELKTNGMEKAKELFTILTRNFTQMSKSGVGLGIINVTWITYVMLFLAVVILGRSAIPFPAKFESYNEYMKNPVRIGIVQPNVPQKKKHDPRNIVPTLVKTGLATRKLAQQQARLVIWPESVILHTRPLKSRRTAPFIKSAAAKNKVYLLSGFIQRTDDKFFNSAVMLGPDGNVRARYDKIHLVPMAEYFPLPKKYRKHKVFDRIGNYTHGTESVVFEIPESKFGVLICFESMFDYLSRRAVKKGAKFLVVVTNDAWFLRSNLAKSHFIMGIFRAVENRVWFVQSANTGISGIIDPWGRPVVKTQMFKDAAVLKVIFPQKGGTFYTRAGNWLPFLCLVGSILLIGAKVVEFIKKRKKESHSKKTKTRKKKKH